MMKKSKNPFYFAIWLIAFIALASCKKKELAINNPKIEVFTRIDLQESGIDFSNDLPFDQEFNVYTYRNYYNGGGVALGDVNNDGLIDIYLTANALKNKLYLNKGNFKFEDITQNANVGGTKSWSTGVTMVDINADGLLDIYVCNSGDVNGDNKQNELFINKGIKPNGTVHFAEEAEKYGLADKGYSTHASFFDYDKDGDLDAYILNNSYQAIGSFNLKKNERPIRDPNGGDKLLENNNGNFIDVSEKAGIYGSVIGFGLGVTIGDLNNDGWADIYVSNDFFERDYLYLNQQNGTFNEVLSTQMKSISGASMGADLADINNDGHPEIFVTEMLPKEYARLKTVTTFEDWDKYRYNVTNGYHHQYTRNTLQLNNGDNTFSEVGRYSGVDATDWSWGALFFDMDNDGKKDLFIANGIYQDLTDQDYLQYISNEEIVKDIVTKKGIDYQKLIAAIPSRKVPNQAYHNLGNLNFEPYLNSGLLEPSFSNGSAYGDLDNDGDLDLVVNNVNSPPFIYQNNTANNSGNNYIKLVLNGQGQNTHAIGTKIQVYLENDTLYYEQQPVRGFQSSVDQRPNIGVGTSVQATLRVIWPDGRTTLKKDIKTNNTIELFQDQATEFFTYGPIMEKPIFKKPIPQLNFVHVEDNFVDFNRDRLLYAMMSAEGPKMAAGDVNNDGEIDIFIGSSTIGDPKLYFGDDNNFVVSEQPAFRENANSEDAESHFFDADNDGDLDLYVCSGSVEYSNYSPNYLDRLYINDGKGIFSKSNQNLPVDQTYHSSSTVTSADIDNDGDIDLFVGERAIPSQYGLKGSGFLLINNGFGQFKDATKDLAPELINIGMITDAELVDFDNDKDADLVIVGEFMEVSFFENKNGKFNSIPKLKLDLKGWWNTIKVVDIDNDGDNDLIIGNHGLNSRFKASNLQPIKLYVNDFDNNGKMDPILTFTAENGKDYPYALRHDLTNQLKHLQKKFPDYKSFQDASLSEILDNAQIENSTVLEANNLETILLVNDGDFNFHQKVLPYNVQLAPIFAIEAQDFDGDGDIDIVMGGNQYRAKPEVGRYDASFGLFLENQGNANFVAKHSDSGFFVDGEIRSILAIPNKKMVLVTRNNDTLVQLSYEK